MGMLLRTRKAKIAIGVKISVVLIVTLTYMLLPAAEKKSSPPSSDNDVAGTLINLTTDFKYLINDFHKLCIIQILSTLIY